MVSDLDAALLRLERLHRDALLADAEREVARDALLGITQTPHAGRAIRVLASNILGPRAGGSIILLDVFTRARLRRAGYDWPRLALELEPEALKRRLLGLPYAAAPERWDDLVAKLEQLRELLSHEHLSPDEAGSVKYALLARLDWLSLVGELVWLRETQDDLVFWRREDGWGVLDADVDDLYREVLQRWPHDKSPIHGQRVHHYDDWVDDQVWRRYNELIADGDVAFLRSQGVRRLDGGRWHF